MKGEDKKEFFFFFITLRILRKQMLTDMKKGMELLLV